MKRLLAFILTAAVCLCGYATPGFAIEPETTIQLAALEITAPFDPDKVDVIRTYDAPANKVTAIVLDKISGEVLDEYSEQPEIPISVIENRATDVRANSEIAPYYDNYNTTLSRTRTIATADGMSVQTIVWAEVNVTASTSWGQIERVNSAGQYAASGSYYLESPHTYSSTTRFPTNTIVIGYQGTVTVTQGNTAGFSYSGLLSAGFGMSGSSSSTWYARKYYSSTVSIRLR